MLARLTKATRTKDKGFTLIELLVVIIIIGILAAIAIPIFLNQRKKGVDASIKSDVKTLATSIETYATDNQTYPPANVVTQTGVGADVMVGGIPADPAATPPVVASGGERSTVSTGNVLTYSVNAATKRYVICGSNANGNATSPKVFVYDSTGGGLLTGVQASCPPA